MELSSAKYKELIKEPLRNPCHLRIKFGLIDPTAPGKSTLSDNGHTYFSNLNNVELDVIKPTREYGTLEDFFWVLNDVQEIPRPTTEEQLYQGYVSDVLSDEDGVFTVPPTITIDYGEEVVKMAGLTFNFDTLNGDYPTQLTIHTFVNSDEEPLDTIIVEPTSSEWIVDHQFQYHNRMTIEFNKTNVPYRRARLMELIYGIIKMYDTSILTESTNIIKANESKEISLINKNLPKNEFSFTVNNISGNFDTDNPTGLNAFLTERQPIEYWWGIEDDNRNIEWIHGNKLITTSKVTSDNTSVTVTCTDQLSNMNSKYLRGLYRPDGISLYDLAVEVLTWTGLHVDDNGNPTYIFDNSLRNIMTKAPLPKDTAKACLQLIASAGNCVLYTDRDGILHMDKLGNVSTNYRADLNMFLKEPPRTDRIELVKTISSEYYTFSIESSTTEVGKLETNLVGTETIIIEYDNASDCVATVTGGTLNNATYYSNSCELNITANGDITVVINGKKINKSATKVDRDINITGITTSYENPLLTSYEVCNNVIDNIAICIENRNIYDADFVGDPTLDLLDIIDVETKFTNSLDSIVTSTDINYNGSFNGKIKFLKKDLQSQ